MKEMSTLTFPNKAEPYEIVDAAARSDIADLKSNRETKSDAQAKLLEAKSYTDTAVDTAKNDLLNGAGAAYDTLKELGDLISENVDAIDALETVAANKQNKLSGSEGQFVGFDNTGNAVPQNSPIPSSTASDNGKVLTVANGVPVWSEGAPICIFDIDDDGVLFSTNSLPILPSAEEGEF